MSGTYPTPQFKALTLREDTGATDAHLLECKSGGTVVGGLALVGGAFFAGELSDARTKEFEGNANVADILAQLCAVPIHMGRRRQSPNTPLRPMVAAHEVQARSFLAGAVTGQKSDIQMQQVAYGGSAWGVAMLAGIQALAAENKVLRRRLAALEALPAE
ncbi:hypothetical protein UAJ10_09285 [Nitrospirillum sp. BR 11164]|uniref:hypothetical protein n=1 Tax=Nitrospirillum sp. BR 11164 TaxID=3104324 RepID=UPI002AFE8B3A|nr:hypothetical protein [Nitrospirillum sp. BR 11164]MEA1649210.1 hypothetical protein [Nitrospirillum sp. BR 11164]